MIEGTVVDTRSKVDETPAPVDQSSTTPIDSGKEVTPVDQKPIDTDQTLTKE